MQFFQLLHGPVCDSNIEVLRLSFEQLFFQLCVNYFARQRRNTASQTPISLSLRR